MKHRILTTHVGSLPRPENLIELYRAKEPPSELPARLREAVADVVRKQVDAGIDIVNDGEFGKPTRAAIDFGAWAAYVTERLTGYEFKPMARAVLIGKDRSDFRDFYASYWDVPTGVPPQFPVCTGPIRYMGHEQLQRDIANLRNAINPVPVEAAFLPLASPSSIEAIYPNAYYKTHEEYGWALAEALKQEYATAAKSGFLVQIDDPGLVVLWDWWFAIDKTFADYHKFAEQRVEMLNHALAGIPEKQIRYHVCWGSWHGPHSSDVELRAIVDVILQVKAGAYSLEAGNVRHEHDWKVWQDVRLPEGKILIPGVVSHATNLLEHPELVADRIEKYARFAGRENVIAGTDCGLGGRIHPQLA
jgi:5-methyltetrahydropteroyltriglutamate--homocysteine methyltransferase